MQVSQLMSKKLITIAPDDSVEDAVKMLRRRGVRHLLVMNGARLVGILSDRDMKRALDPIRVKKRVQSVGGLIFVLEPIKVEEIMTQAPVTVHPGAAVYEAARTMLDRKFGALPVVDRKKVVGIVTETDLLGHYMHQEAKSAQKARRNSSIRKKHRSKRR